MMKKLFTFISSLSRNITIIAGATLVFVMLLTVLDVTLRYFGHPIIGVYDLVALGGSIIIGFSAPYASEKKVHVYMQMPQQKLGQTLKHILYFITRLFAFGISFLITWNLFKLGIDFSRTGEVSHTIHIVYYPIAFGLGVCFLLQTLVFIVQILRPFFERNNE